MAEIHFFSFFRQASSLLIHQELDHFSKLRLLNGSELCLWKWKKLLRLEV